MGDDMTGTAFTTATRVAEFIFDCDGAAVERPRDILAWLEATTYKPTYDGKAV